MPGKNTNLHAAKRAKNDEFYTQLTDIEKEISEMQADHIKPWAKGGPTTAENCQMLCADCNRTKSDK